MSDYPVGAEWEVRDNQRRGRVYLRSREKTFEVWWASWTYHDGSSGFPSSEWFTSYRGARDYLLINGRARRVK